MHVVSNYKNLVLTPFAFFIQRELFGGKRIAVL